MTDDIPAPPEQLLTFIIPVGTQVVLKAARRVPDSGDVKPKGSVGEVLESPAGNDRPYLVRFADGVTLRLKFGELAIRRREVDEELATPGEDLRRWVVYRVAVARPSAWPPRPPTRTAAASSCRPPR
jgi:hypothetical protein